MAQPVASDEPVWVKDDDEDLDELVDLNHDKEAESTARQIDLQVQLCMLVCCLLFALISLIALSWRKYGAIIIRSRHDPNWKVREESPSMGPRSPNKKKD